MIHMKKVTLREFKHNSRYQRMAHDGHPVLVTHRGKPYFVACRRTKSAPFWALHGPEQRSQPSCWTPCWVKMNGTPHDECLARYGFVDQRGEGTGDTVGSRAHHSARRNQYLLSVGH